MNQKYLIHFLIFSFFLVNCQHIERRQQLQMSDKEEELGNASTGYYKDKIKELEKGLLTRQDKALYSKLLPWFITDEEKLSFLRNTDYEEKQKWVMKSQILGRPSTLTIKYKKIIDSQDIAIGMPNDLVKKSWGDPLSVESSGNPMFKNEKWRYLRTVSSTDGFRQERRVVYFEGGRVIGWETE